jgi:nucleoid-associated protein YgaU
MRPLDRTERYGLVSVVFLVTTIAAVTLWDTETPGTEPEKEDSEMVSGNALGALSGAGGRTPGAPAASERLDAARGGPPLSLPRPGGPASRTSASAAGEAAAGTSGLLSPPRGSGAQRSGGATVLRGDDSLRGLPPRTDSGTGRRSEAWTASERTPNPERTPVAPEPVLADAARGGRVNGGSSLLRDVPGVNRTVELRPGETLSEVALRELGSSRLWTQIAELNGIADATKVRAGAVLRLPPRTAGAAAGAPADEIASAPPPTPPTPPSPAGTVPYQVQEGESYWRLSKRFLGKGSRWKELLALNPDVPPEKLRAGRTIAVPAAALASTAPTAAPVTGAIVADAGGSRPKRGRVQ